MTEPEQPELEQTTEAQAVVEGQSAAGQAPEEEGPPPTERLPSILESLLFASNRPLSVADLKKLLGERDAKKIGAALDALREQRAGSGVEVANVAGGYMLRTSVDNGPWVSRLLTGRPLRLSRAMMETLAIVAYRQPVTRPEIDDIRGVDCGPVLHTLLDRGLIRMIGKKEEVGRPILYGTTPEFLRTFNLKDLADLPTLREFAELSAEDQAHVEATHGPGELTPWEPPTPDESENDHLLSDLEAATETATRLTRKPRRTRGFAAAGEGDGESGGTADDAAGEGAGQDVSDDASDDGASVDAAAPE